VSTKDVTDLMVIEAYRRSEQERGPDWRNDYRWPYEHLMETTGECFKVCYRAMERAASRGFIDYGVSLRTGWVTDEGKTLEDQRKNPASQPGTDEVKPVAWDTERGQNKEHECKDIQD